MIGSKIAVIIEEIGQSYQSTILSGINQGAKEFGLNIAAFTSFSGRPPERCAIRRSLQRLTLLLKLELPLKALTSIPGSNTGERREISPSQI